VNAIGVGIDLVDVQRVVEMLERKQDRVIRKFLTDNERDYCLGQTNPAQHIAARIAAKEAAYKALQLTPEARGIGWRDLEVARDATGFPRMVLHGRAREVADESGVHDALLSLSHSNLQAAAVVILRG
jgi:holo-[acyl-carrier protein] synthase